MDDLLPGMLHLTRDGGETLTRQLTDQLRRLITEGRLAPGQRLPSSRLLAQSLGLSRPEPGSPRDRNVMIDHAAEKLAKGERLLADPNDPNFLGENRNNPGHERYTGKRIDTPKAHVTEESGRSYKIEGAVVDGEIIKPGEPMPPKESE